MDNFDILNELYDLTASKLPSTTDIKLETLQQSKQNKLETLTNFKKDKLIGLQDADTPITQNLGSIREDGIMQRYDAVELKHGNAPYDMKGVDKKADPDTHGKSTYAMQTQKEQVARLLGKSVSSLTAQDMIDVGNMQQIQKLADLSRSGNEQRWEAPLVRGVTQANLTGRYVDDKGRNVNIPLGIDVTTNVSGKDVYGRPLTQIGNKAGENVTEMSAQDSRLNAFAQPTVSGTSREELGDMMHPRLNKDYSTIGDRLSNIVDSVQYSLGGIAAGVTDAVIDTGANLAERISKSVGGKSGKEFYENVNKGGLIELDESGNFKGLDKYKTAEEYGYDPTRVQNFMSEIKNDWEKGDYLGVVGSMLKGVVTAGPELIGESTGEIVATSLKAAGLLATAMNYSNKIMEDRKKIVGDEYSDIDRAYAIAGGAAQALLNKIGGDELLGRTNIVKDALSTLGKTESPKAIMNGIKSVAKAAVLVGGKGVYEGLEEVAQEAAGLIATKLDTKQQETLFNDKDVVSLVQSFAGGFGAGGLMASPRPVADIGKAAKDVAYRGIELAVETPAQKQERVMREEMAPVYDSAVEAAMTGDSAKVEELSSALHGKYGDIDMSAPKGYTYSRIFAQALSSAETEEAQNKVLETMNKLDADKKSAFSAKEVLKEVIDGTMEDFIKTVNKKNIADVEEALYADVEAKADEMIESNPAKIAHVEKLQKMLENSKRKFTETIDSLKGSDPIIDELNNSIDILDKYLKEKNVDSVNAEVSKLGYISKDPLTGKVDVSKPGLAGYEKKLLGAIHNTKTQNNLADEKVLTSGGANLGALENFAESRVSKLVPGKTIKETFQTEKLAKDLVSENKQIEATVQRIKDAVNNAATITDENKTKYNEYLDRSLDNISKSNKHLNFAIKSISKVAEITGTNDRLRMVVGKDNTYSITNDKGKVYARLVDKQWKIDEKVARGMAQNKVVQESTTAETPAQTEVINEGFEKERLIKAQTGEYESEYARAKEAPVVTSGEKVQEKPKGPDGFEARFKQIVDKVGQIDKQLADMMMTDKLQALPELRRYKQKVKQEWDNRKSKIDKLLDRANKFLESGSDKSVLNNILSKINSYMTDMARVIRSLISKKQELKKEYTKTLDTLDSLVGELSGLEGEYISKETIETQIGSVNIVNESPYGKFVSKGNVRKPVVRTGKQSEQTSVMNAVNEIAKEKASKMKNSNSLGERILGTIYENGIAGVKARVFKKGRDSIFGGVEKGKTLFGLSNSEIVEKLPKAFKDYFATDEESRNTLNKNIDVLRRFIKDVNIGELTVNTIKLDKNGTVDVVNNYAQVLSMLGETVGHKVLEGGKKIDVIKLDGQVEELVKFYTAKAMSDAVKVQSNFLVRSKSDVMRDYGINEETYDELLEYAKEGYVNAASIRGDIAKDMYNALGIKVNRDIAEVTENAIIETLGLIVQSVAIDNGLMERLEYSETFSDTRHRIMVRPDWSKVDRKLLVPAINKLQYMNESMARALVTEQPIVNDVKKKMNMDDYIASEPLAFINEQQQVKYRIDDSFEHMLELDEDVALEVMGRQSTDGKHVSKVSKINAINDKLMREFNFLKDTYKSLKGKEFHLEWGQTASDRITILNDLHFQESKLHREYVNVVGQEVEIDTKNEDQMNVFKVSIMQGLDRKPDKLSAGTVLNDFDKLVKINKDGIEILEEGAIKDAVEAMIAGGMNSKAMNEVFANSEGFHGIAAIHALVELDKALKGDGKFTPNLKVEIDAITSGMILTLMQIGSDAAIEMMAKGGVFTEQTMAKWKKYVKDQGVDGEFTPGALIEAGAKHAKVLQAELKAIMDDDTLDIQAKYEERAKIWSKMQNEMFMDIYATAGIGMVSEVENYKAELIGKKKKGQLDNDILAMLDQIGDFTYSSIRTIAKSPVMVYIYGATIGSIKQKLGYSLGVDTVVSALEELSRRQKAGEDTTELEQFVDRFVSKKYVDEYGKPMDVSGMEEWEKTLHRDINKHNIEYIQKVISMSFGKGLEKSFKDNFEFIDDYRNAVKSVEMITFEAYKIKLEEAITNVVRAKYGQDVDVSKVSAASISKEDLININNELVDAGFGHGIAWYREDGTVRHQSLNKTGDKYSSTSASFKLNGKDVTGSIKTKVQEVNTGAAPTISIHAEDSEIIQETLRKLSVHGGNVYDAMVLPLDSNVLKEAADKYNTNTIDIGFGRSILADNVRKLESMLTNMSGEQLNKLAENMAVVKGHDTKYAKEANRLKLNTNLMKLLLVKAGKVNEKRVKNSGNVFYSGHSHIALAGMVKVDGKTRSKSIESMENTLKLLDKVTVKEADKQVNDIIADIKKLNISNIDKIVNMVKDC